MGELECLVVCIDDPEQRNPNVTRYLELQYWVRMLRVFGLVQDFPVAILIVFDGARKIE